MLAPRLGLHVKMTASRSRVKWVDQSNARTAWNVLLVRGCPWNVEMWYLQAPPSSANHVCLVKHILQHTRPAPAKIVRTVVRIARPSKPAHWLPRPCAESVRLALTRNQCWVCASRALLVVMTATIYLCQSAKCPVCQNTCAARLWGQKSAANWSLMRTSAQQLLHCSQPALQQYPLRTTKQRQPCHHTWN